MGEKTWKENISTDAVMVSFNSLKWNGQLSAVVQNLIHIESSKEGRSIQFFCSSLTSLKIGLIWGGRQRNAER